MKTIRIAITALFTLGGIACIALVLLLYFTSGTQASIAKKLNEIYFQPKADAEVGRLITTGIFTNSQENELRHFVRRLYVSDCTILIYGIGAGALALGISLFAAACSVWTSYRVSTLSQRLRYQDVPGALQP